MQQSELIGREHTAVVVSEMQRGIIGDLAPPATRQLAHAVESAGLPGRLTEFCLAARKFAVPIAFRLLGPTPTTNDVLAAWQQS